MQSSQNARSAAVLQLLCEVAGITLDGRDARTSHMRRPLLTLALQTDGRGRFSKKVRSQRVRWKAIILHHLLVMEQPTFYPAVIIAPRSAQLLNHCWRVYHVGLRIFDQLSRRAVNSSDFLLFLAPWCANSACGSALPLFC
jgi:hypothetical protein